MRTKMSDVGIYTTPQTLLHKMVDGRKSEGREAFWDFSSHPKKIKVESGDKLWFATQNRWQGYFIIEAVSRDIAGNVEEIIFDSETWHPYKNTPAPRTPFQGFTYRIPQ